MKKFMTNDSFFRIALILSLVLCLIGNNAFSQEKNRLPKYSSPFLESFALEWNTLTVSTIQEISDSLSCKDILIDFFEDYGERAMVFDEKYTEQNFRLISKQKFSVEYDMIIIETWRDGFCSVEEKIVFRKKNNNSYEKIKYLGGCGQFDWELLENKYSINLKKNIIYFSDIYANSIDCDNLYIITIIEKEKLSIYPLFLSNSNKTKLLRII